MILDWLRCVNLKKIIIVFTRWSNLCMHYYFILKLFSYCMYCYFTFAFVSYILSC